MNAATTDRTDLILAAQTGDAGSIEHLLAVCQADARRYARRHCHVSDVVKAGMKGEEHWKKKQSKSNSHSTTAFVPCHTAQNTAGRPACFTPQSRYEFQN